MAKIYQLLSFALLILIIHCCINFTVAQYGIGYAKVPNRPPGGKCKESCEESEERIELNTNCGSGLIYCYNPNYSFRSDVKKFFGIDNVPLKKDECLIRSEVSGGPTERMAGSKCRKTCKSAEGEINGSIAVCRSGLTCCKDSNYSPFMRWFQDIWLSKNSIG